MDIDVPLRKYVLIGALCIFCFGGLFTALYLASERIQERKNTLHDETIYVATAAGEAFKVHAIHRCGKGNVRKAAIQVTHNQSERISPASYELLEVMTNDWTRIYHGNVRSNRCEIKELTFTNITGHAYIVTETE